MNRATNAREALLAEALGDIASLLARIETLAPALELARHALVDANRELTTQAEAFERQMTRLSDTAQRGAVAHIARHTAELARQSTERQTQAMTDAAQGIFSAEMGLALRPVIESLQRATRRADRPWDQWAMHAATAVSSSAMTWAVVAFGLYC